MTPDQEQALQTKMTSIGYPDFAVLPGEDNILMLHVQERLICGALYGLSMPDTQLKALIDETVPQVAPPPRAVPEMRGG